MPITPCDARLGAHYRLATPAEKQHYHAPAGQRLLVTDDPEAHVKWILVDAQSQEPIKRGYTEQYIAFYQAIKLQRLARLHQQLPDLYKKILPEIELDESSPHPSANYQNALILHHIIVMGMRLGGDQTPGLAPDYGACHLRCDHFSINRDIPLNTLLLDFTGRNGIAQNHVLRDHHIFRRTFQREKSGYEYLFDNTAEDFLTYLDQFTEGQFTVHLLRSYHATALAVHLMRQEQSSPSSAHKRKPFVTHRTPPPASPPLDDVPSHLLEPLEDLPDSIVNGASMRQLYVAMDHFINKAKSRQEEFPEEFVQYPTTYELEEEQRADEMDEEAARQKAADVSQD